MNTSPKFPLAHVTEGYAMGASAVDNATYVSFNLKPAYRDTPIEKLESLLAGSFEYPVLLERLPNKHDLVFNYKVTPQEV